MGDGGGPTEPTFIDRHIKRRTVLKGAGAGAALLLVGDKVFAAVGPVISPTILNANPALVVDVLRPEDFLRVSMEFVNLALDTSVPNAPVLKRKNLNKAAMVVVDFGPQAVAEQVLWEGHDSIPPANAGIQSRLAGNSRLAFFVPNDVNTIPYDVDTLLDWSTYTQSVVPVALPGTPANKSSINPAAIIRFVFPGLRAPKDNETQIEVPWWLVLSPSANAAWAHATQPVSHFNRTELWHTRLGTKSGNTVDEANPDSVRAVWARDPKIKNYLKNNPNPVPPGINDDLANNPFPPKEGLPFRMAYTPQDRRDAIRNSADWSLSNPLLRGRYTPTPFKTDRLMLTALGAYIDIDGTWPTNPFGNSLLEWKNRGTLGRDHYVRIVNKGYLLPHGHRAVLVRESERKFLTGSAGRAAYLRLRTFFVPIQFVREYPNSQGLPNEGRNFPLQKVEILSRVSPDFASIVNLGNSPFHAFQPLDSNGDPIRLQFRGTDWAGNTAPFDSPFIFVEDANDAPFDSAIMGPINDDYRALPAVQRTANFGGNAVAFAAEDKPGDTTFPVESMVFGALDVADAAAKDVYKAADQIRSFPLLDVGKIKLPDIEKLAGDAGLAPAINYVSNYVEHEFADAFNKGKAFLQMVDPNDPSSPLGQALNFATENAGGLASPNQALSAITRDLGPVAGPLGDVLNKKFDPASVFPDDAAKILGGIPLKDILAVIEDLTGDAEKAINYIKEQLPTELKISFVWKPELQKDEPLHVFEPSTDDPKATAELNGELRQSLTNPDDRSFKFNGEITNFKLNLIGDGATLFLIIDVAKLGFKSGSGQKTDITVKINDITFAGALAFVEELRTILENLGDGFGIKVDAAAITAQMNIEIPTITVGIFSLSNLAFNAGLTVPLDGSPVRVRFGLSTRDNPFILTIYIFGGGGWLGIALGADGMEILEIGFEFGAKLALDVGVASGGVEAMAGIYLKIENTPKGDNVTLEGFLKIDGHVSVLGIVSVSIEIYLSFQYMHKPPDMNIVTGKAKATLSVSVLFFSISVSFEVEKSFGGNPADPTFTDAISTSDWATYCDAFATVA